MVIVKKYLLPLIIDKPLFEVKGYEKYEIVNKSYNIVPKTEKPKVQPVVYKENPPFAINPYQFRDKPYYFRELINVFDVVESSINKRTQKLKEYSYYIDSSKIEYTTPFQLNIIDSNIKNTILKGENIFLGTKNILSIKETYKTFNFQKEKKSFFIKPNIKYVSQKIKNIYNDSILTIKYKQSKNITEYENSKINYHLLTIVEPKKLENKYKKIGEFEMFIYEKENNEKEFISPQSLQDTYNNPTLEIEVPLGYEIVIFKVPSDDIKISKIVENVSDIEKQEYYLTLIDKNTLIGKFIVPDKMYKFSIGLNNGQIFELIIKTKNTTPY